MHYPFVRPVSGRLDSGSYADAFMHLGSCIVVADRIAVTCAHVLAPTCYDWEYVPTHELETRLPNKVEILDGPGNRATPVTVHLERDRDIAILVFDRDLGIRPATIALGIEAVGPSAALRAVGFAAESAGREAQITPFPAPTFEVLPVSERDESMPIRFEIRAGVSPGNSGGAILVEDGELRPVFGMIRMGVGGTEGCTSYRLLQFLAAHQYWPTSFMFWEEPGTARERTADTQRWSIARLFGFDEPRLELDGGDAFPPLDFSVLPPAQFSGPAGETFVVGRPVAMMTAPVARRLLKALGYDSTPGARDMALGLTMPKVEDLAAKLGRLSGISFRIPTLAEWWLGTTACRVAADPVAIHGYAGGTISTTERAPNAWDIRPTPTAAREWVRRTSDVHPISVRADGHTLPMPPGQTLNNLGVRFVVDLVSRRG